MIEYLCDKDVIWDLIRMSFIDVHIILIFYKLKNLQKLVCSILFHNQKYNKLFLFKLVCEIILSWDELIELSSEE